MATTDNSVWQLATDGDVDEVKTRLRACPEEINKKAGPKFTTPLMQACANNHYDVVNVLLEAREVKADIRIRDKDDASCVHWAAGHSPQSLSLIISVVIQDGLEEELYTEDHEGNTPLHCAAKSGQYASCTLLVAAGVEAPLKLKNHRGFTAEMIAYKLAENKRTGDFLHKMRLCVEGKYAVDGKCYLCKLSLSFLCCNC